MQQTFVIIFAFFCLAFAANDEPLNQPPEVPVVPVVFPPDGPQLLWHAFQNFIANNNNLEKPLENVVSGLNQNCGTSSTPATSETPETTTESRQKQRIQTPHKGAKKHAKRRGNENYHKHQKKNASKN